MLAVPWKPTSNSFLLYFGLHVFQCFSAVTAINVTLQSSLWCPALWALLAAGGERLPKVDSQKHPGQSNTMKNWENTGREQHLCRYIHHHTHLWAIKDDWDGLNLYICIFVLHLYLNNCRFIFNNGQGNISKNIVCEHSSLLHLQMQVETVPCKEETVY